MRIMNPTRRAFLTTGVLGAAALATAGWLRLRAPRDAAGHALDADGRAIVASMVPAFLAGALPAREPERGDAIRETVASIEQAIAGLPPAAQRELAQLFALLAFAPARVVLTGTTTDWAQASVADVDAVLERWRESRIALLRSAYDGLHQLVLAAWYGNPRAWPAIGYPGPPPLA
jgi:hypothetical protein